MNQTQIKNYYKSDIFHFNEDTNNHPKKLFVQENVLKNQEKNQKKN